MRVQAIMVLLFLSMIVQAVMDVSAGHDSPICHDSGFVFMIVKAIIVS